MEATKTGAASWNLDKYTNCDSSQHIGMFTNHIVAKERKRRGTDSHTLTCKVLLVTTVSCKTPSKALKPAINMTKGELPKGKG